jgi:hypothetical protein
MAILEKEVYISPTILEKEYYIEKGYSVPSYFDRDGKERVSRKVSIMVKVDDLKETNGVKVTKICDICKKKTPNQSYRIIIASREKGDRKDRCFECSKLIKGSRIKSNLSYEKSLEYWALNEDKEYLLSEFSRKNIITPSKISRRTTDKYIWYCFECKNEYPASADSRVNGSGCPYCSNVKVMKGYNDMWTTNPSLASMLYNLEDGYKYTQKSTLKLDWKCPCCKFIVKNKKILDVCRNGISCSKCSDGISYPEKIMGNVLTQLGVKFNKEKIFKWSNSKRYDFYIPSLSMIIETHGNQHYEETARGRNLKEEKENDRYKNEQAIKNGIENYIVIDCRYSDLEYIKKNMINSELNKHFDLNKVDFDLAHKESLKTNVIKACELYNKGFLLTEISKILDINISTVSSYLKKGSITDFCNYQPSLKVEKEVVQLTLDHIFIRIHTNAKQASLDTSISQGNISRACKKSNVRTAGGYRWMYKENYDKYIEQNKNELILT